MYRKMYRYSGIFWNYRDSTSIAEKDRKKRITVTAVAVQKKVTKPNPDLNLDDLPTEKTLGVQWDCESDKIVFKILPIKEVFSKREEVASLFDVLGFLVPKILTAKIILQKNGREGLQWKKRLPEEIFNEWRSWVSDLSPIKHMSCAKQTTKQQQNHEALLFYG